MTSPTSDTPTQLTKAGTIHSALTQFADASLADLSTIEVTPDCEYLRSKQFPIKEVSINAQKERNSPKYNLNRIHQYWSRKPLGYCRAVIYASMVPDETHPEKKCLGCQKKLQSA